MSNVPENLKYTKEHEWALIDGDVVTVGITDHAQSELGDIVFVELPAVGTEVAKDEAFGSIEAVKAVSDLYAPISGEVVEINEVLEDAPETVNEDAYGKGWMLKIKVSEAADLDTLLSSADYLALI